MRRTTSIYLASAIDQKKTDTGPYAMVSQAISRSGYVVYDPKKAFSVDPVLMQNVKYEEAETAARYVFGVNYAALKHADVRVFVVDETASWGIPIEMRETVDNRWAFALVINTEAIMPMYLRVMLSLVGAEIAQSDNNELAAILYKRLSEDPSTKYAIWYFGGRK